MITQKPSFVRSLQSTKHKTVWGEIIDEDSLDVIEKVWSLPLAKKEPGKKSTMTFLEERIPFKMEIIEVKRDNN